MRFKQGGSLGGVQGEFYSAGLAGSFAGVVGHTKSGSYGIEGRRWYGKIAKSLTKLTKKDSFGWGPTTQMAFEQQKKVIVTTLVMRLQNFSQPFEIECDASGKGIGAVLMQNQHPIAYFSKALSKRNLVK